MTQFKLIYNHSVKKLLLLLILSFFSAQGLADGCPDGSEPIKSVSADGSYYVYNCGGSLESGELPFNHSAWVAENRYAETIGPEWTSKLRSMYNTQWNTWHFTADMNNDGILDFVYTPMFPMENLGGSGSVKTEDLSDAEHGHCRDEVCRGESALPSIYFGRSDGTWVYGTGAFVDNRENPGYRMCPSNVADFNGDGRPDLFCNDTLDDEGSGPNGVKEWNGHRDSYYLSQPDGTWLESSDTHLSIPNFQVFDHDFAIGDIDSDGDNDIIISTSEGSSYCWRNNGKGYMKLDKNCARGVKAFMLELADMDGDGDLDLISFHMEDYSKKWAGATAIHYNNGSGQFRLNSVKLKEYGGEWDWNGAIDIRAADFDGDGDMDILISRFRNPYVGLAYEIKENLGNGKFGSVMDIRFDIPNYTVEKHKKIVWEGSSWNVSQRMNLVDFNNDGLMDFVSYAGGRFSNYVYISNGDMTFTEIKQNDRPTPLVRISGAKMVDTDNFYMEDMH